MKKDHKITKGRPGIIGRFIWSIGCFVSRQLYNKSLNLQFQGYEVFDKLKPPYLLIANHVSNYDPVIVSSNQNHLVHWVANDAVFRHPFVRWAFEKVQTIPKTKGMSDLDTIRIMHQKVREGAVVGLFPEGKTCWDGKTQHLLPATAKLVKLLKVPVISVTIRGAYMTQPRWVWSKNRRRSRILLDARLLVQKEEIKSMSVEEVDLRLSEGLANDDFKFIRENSVRLESENRAEHLELYTFICPKCGRLEALRSKGNDVVCIHCMWHFTIDPYGQFPRDKDFPFADLSEWNEWQQKETRKRVEAYLLDEKASLSLLEDRGITLLTGAGLVPLKTLCRGDAQLLKDRILFTPYKGAPMNFLLDEVDAISIFKQQKLEFYYKKVLYRFHYNNPWDSAFKWLSFVEALQEV
ncbi:MAG: hypothetical protein B6241_10560 [Spirochaetaceae bacterium 4572_59]|nr:MAG: hypothetical protein B6241_10560 [Spirochaetaceae bacterium 4572_59]